MPRPLALITGASSGIGRELASTFAVHDHDLVVTADDDIQTAAQRLRAEGHADVVAVRADLSTSEGVEQLIAAVVERGRPVDVLVLNAGVGNSGAFVDVPLVDEQRLIGLNISATVQLAKQFVPSMVDRGEGKVLITSSIAATSPGPYYATYAASKAFLLSFSEALRYELKDYGVTVTALMPGPTDTEFFERAGMQDTPVQDADKDDPEQVAEEAYAALMAGEDHVVTGSFKNKVQAVSGRVMSEPMKAGMHARMTKPSDER